jgi:DNA-binding MarR family transcriptional regulator
MPQGEVRPDQGTTVAMLGAAYSLLGFDIVDGVVGAGFPIKPNHSAVFGQIGPAGSRLTDLARGANVTPQSMGQIVDELETLGYVERTPDPSDRRAKLIKLTAKGSEAVQAGVATIGGIEDELVNRLGNRDYQKLRQILAKILAR